MDEKVGLIACESHPDRSFVCMYDLHVYREDGGDVKELIQKIRDYSPSAKYCIGPDGHPLHLGEWSSHANDLAWASREFHGSSYSLFAERAKTGEMWSVIANNGESHFMPQRIYTD